MPPPTWSTWPIERRLIDPASCSIDRLVSDLTVTREGTGWRVEGIGARRAVSFSDLTDPDAARLAAARLDPDRSRRCPRRRRCPTG